MLEHGFEVLTEFKFDVAAAIVNSEKLQSSVGQLSDAADRALLSMRSLSVGILGSFGLGVTSLLGVLSSAVMYADKFNQYQIKIANQFQNGGMYKGAGGFQLAMEASESALMNMQKVAQEFSLPSTDLVNTATLIGAALTTKGMDNSSLTKSTDLARMYMKVSPMLGVDTSVSQGELLGLIGGRADMGGRLVQRLFGDTKTLRQFNGQGGTQAYNKLEEHKRLDMLSKAMGELANNMDAAHAMAGTFNGQMQLLKDNLFGLFSVFKEVGNIIKAPLTQMMTVLNTWIKEHGRKLIGSIAGMLGPMLANPEKLFINLLQMRSLKGDVKSTGHALEAGGLLFGLGEALSFLKVTGALATPWMVLVGAGLYALGDALSRTSPFLAPFVGFMRSVFKIFSIGAGIFGAIGMLFGRAAAMVVLEGLFGVLAGTLGSLLMIGLPLLAFFQLLSRAVAIAAVDDVKAASQNMDHWVDTFTHFKNLGSIFADPMGELFDSLARFISPAFRISNIIGFLDFGVTRLTQDFTNLTMGIFGVEYAIFQVISNVNDMIHGRLGIGKVFSGVSDAYEAGMKDVYERVYGAIEKGETSAVQKNNINMNVNMTNQFKEQMEPDRIAFALKDQLLKAATNSTRPYGSTQAGRAARG